MNQQVIDYIKKSRELGHSDTDIKTALLNAGHKEEDVRAAFDAADGKNIVPLPPPPFNPCLDSQAAIVKKESHTLLIISLVLIPFVLVGLYFGAIWLLDPSSILDETIDIQRTNDISSVSSAVELYLATTDGKFGCKTGQVYTSLSGTTAVDGTGWLPVDLSKTPGGSPLFYLPTDPKQTEDPNYFYSFACDPKAHTYEFDARLKTKKWMQKAAATDHGSDPTIYESGHDLNLIK